MSHKSSPGDGSHGRGVKGGGVYGRGFKSPVELTGGKSIFRSLFHLLRILRTHRAGQ